MPFQMMLEQVLEVVAEHKGTGRAVAELLLVGQESLQATIEFHEGVLMSCQIAGLRSRRALFQGVQAQQMIQHQLLSWTFSYQSSTHLPSNESTEERSSSLVRVAESSFVSSVKARPRHLRHLDAATFSHMVVLIQPGQHARRYWQVYILLDGQRSIEGIAAILHVSTEQVLQIVNDFIRRGYVTVF